MEMARLRWIFIFSFATLIPSLWANIGEFDKYWEGRALEAQEHAMKSYNPNPYQVVDQFSTANETTTPKTRRGLEGKRNKPKEACRAVNPMDKCWRCQPNWADNRYKLADCARGFGHNANGGKNGRIYVVTSNQDKDLVNPAPGTLRHAVIQKEPLWIIFGHDMYIKLSQELIITSDKTIDGRGANVHIAHGAGITIQYVRNVIITNLHIHHIVPAEGGLIRDSVDHYGTRTRSDGDGISIFGSSDVWLDHLSMSRCDDGLIDAIQGSTGITISNSHFTHHNDVILLGASDSYQPDENMQVTVAYNHFGKGLIQRMPRCRWGFFHVVNNDYTHWELYAIGGSSHPTILSQGNRFIAPPHLPYSKQVYNEYLTRNLIWSHFRAYKRSFLVYQAKDFRNPLYSSEKLPKAWSNQSISPFPSKVYQHNGSNLGLPPVPSML